MRYFLVLLFSLVLITSCGPVQPIQTNLETPSPVNIVREPTITHAPTQTLTLPTPSPLPRLPVVSVFTPDIVQVVNWKEYQTELSKAILPGVAGTIVCEWDILGRTDMEVYVWAVCYGQNKFDALPAVIYLDSLGSVQKVAVPRRGSSWDGYIRKLFPSDVIEQIEIYLYFSAMNTGRAEVMETRAKYRFLLKEEPPENIANAFYVTPPSNSINFIVTPTQNQMKNWKGYESAIREKMITPEIIISGNALCEWYIVGRSYQQEYVYAICMGLALDVDLPFFMRDNFYLVDTDADGNIVNLEFAGETPDSTYEKLFPNYVMQIYQNGLFSAESEKLAIHLRWRLLHPEEPPLIIKQSLPHFNTTPTP